MWISEYFNIGFKQRIVKIFVFMLLLDINYMKYKLEYIKF